MARESPVQSVVVVNVGVGEEDDPALRILGHDLVGPRKHLIARPKFQDQYQPVNPSPR